MTITIIAATVAHDNGAASSITGTVPPGTVDGHVMLAFLMVDGGTGTTVTPPAGWTLQASLNHGTTTKAEVYAKVMTPEYTDYTWFLSPGQTVGLALVACSGVDGESLMDATPLTNMGTGLSADSQDLTTATDGALVFLGVFVQTAARTSLSPPAGYFQVIKNDYTRIFVVNTKTQTLAGATGVAASTFVASTSTPWITIIGALRPMGVQTVPFMLEALS